MTGYRHLLCDILRTPTNFTRTMKNLFITATCALAFLASPSPAGESSAGHPWREIASGSRSNIGQATRKVIRDPEAWKKWWSEHRTVETRLDGEIVPEPPPEVDFEKETVLILTMGTRSTGGFAIRFSGIRREDGVLTASFKTTSPGPDSLVTSALTAPFSIIAVPIHEGRVEFVEASVR